MVPGALKIQDKKQSDIFPLIYIMSPVILLGHPVQEWSVRAFVPQSTNMYDHLLFVTPTFLCLCTAP